MTEQQVQTEENNWSVDTTAPEMTRIEPGTYAGIVSRLEKIATQYDDAAKWYFKPNGMDEEVTGLTSLGTGNLTKPAEWSRRILGLSDATDTKSGKDIKHRKPPRVNWGPLELSGKACRFVVEDREFVSDDGAVQTVSNVTNVLPPAQAPAQVTNLQAAQQATAVGVGAGAAGSEEDFSDIPF
jgi:hypothetical protein